MNPGKKGDWVTNFPRSLKGYWPRRDAKLVEGPPKATFAHTVEELQGRKLIGIYLDEDIPAGIKSRDLLSK